MGEGLAWWLGDGDWYDLRQRRQIEDLEASVSGAYSQASRLRSQLSQVQGSLQTRLDRLASAFDAFVELSDVRSDLAVYTDAVIVRHQVRLMLGAVAAGRAAPPPELPDVPGYWLVPAARALHARLDGDAGAAAKHTEAATELDADRTRYFLAAGTRLAGPVDVTAVHLAGLLPGASRVPVSATQRAFWRATAADAYGDAGRALLTSALAGALGTPGHHAPGGDGEEDAPTAWLGPAGDGMGARTTPQGVAGALAALRQRCEAALRPVGATKDTSGPTGGEPEGGAAGAGAAGAGAGDPELGPPPEVAPLWEVLRSLVDEGHEPERELLRRAERLRGLVETGAAPAEYRSWDAPVGTVRELVHGDVFDGEAGGPALRRVAVRAAAPWLRAAVEGVAAQVAPPQEQVTVRTSGGSFHIGPHGADPGEVAALRRRIDTTYRVSHTREYVGWGVAGLGLLVAVLGFAGAGGAGVGVLGILVLLVGVGVAVKGRRDARDRAESAERERDSLQRTVDSHVQRHRAMREQDTRHREQVAQQRAALSELLG